jgi:hypothetical protein
MTERLLAQNGTHAAVCTGDVVMCWPHAKPEHCETFTFESPVRKIQFGNPFSRSGAIHVLLENNELHLTAGHDAMSKVADNIASIDGDRCVTIDGRILDILEDGDVDVSDGCKFMPDGCTELRFVEPTNLVVTWDDSGILYSNDASSGTRRSWKRHDFRQWFANVGDEIADVVACDPFGILIPKSPVYVTSKSGYQLELCSDLSICHYYNYDGVPHATSWCMGGILDFDRANAFMLMPDDEGFGVESSFQHLLGPEDKVFCGSRRCWL